MKHPAIEELIDEREHVDTCAECAWTAMKLAAEEELVRAAFRLPRRAIWPLLGPAIAAAVLAGIVLWISWPTAPPRASQPAQDAAVQQVIEKVRALRPSDDELAIYRLAWAPTIKEAKARAAKEQRPIFLVVTTNYGSLYTGHC